MKDDLRMLVAVNQSGALGAWFTRIRHLVMTLASRTKGRLFRKYAGLLAALVGTALAISTAIDTYYSFQENREALVAIQREKAIGAATIIEQFVK